MINYCEVCGTKISNTNGICENCAKNNPYSYNGVINRVAIKNKARNILDEHFGQILIASFIVYFFIGIATFISNKLVGDYPFISLLVDLLKSFVFVPLNVGLIFYILNIVREKEIKLEDIFRYYDKRIFFIFGLTFLITLFTSLWTLLFIVPGIIAYFSYSLSYYVMIDNENKNIMEIINESKRLTQSYKGDMFMFSMSFIGWFLLCIITYGVAIVYVLPYVEVSIAIYYEEIKRIKK